MEEIVIPDSVREIDLSAFGGCENLKSIKLPYTLTVLTQIFSDHNERGCESLTELTLPPNLKEIGSQAFDECSSLTSINIPASLKEIDTYYTFEETAITEVIIPDSIKPNSVKGAYSAFSKLKLPLKTKQRLQEISK